MSAYGCIDEVQQVTLTVKLVDHTVENKLRFHDSQIMFTSLFEP